jgi:hypothetical protein
MPILPVACFRLFQRVLQNGRDVPLPYLGDELTKSSPFLVMIYSAISRFAVLVSKKTLIVLRTFPLSLLPMKQDYQPIIHIAIPLKHLFLLIIFFIIF